MKPIKLIIIFLFIVLSARAQDQKELTYFYIEDLSTESYTKWMHSLDNSIQSTIQYTCIPAKIIGVDIKNSSTIKEKLSLVYKEFDLIKLTTKEAEKKCASTRNLK